MSNLPCANPFLCCGSEETNVPVGDVAAMAATILRD